MVDPIFLFKAPAIRTKTIAILSYKAFRTFEVAGSRITILAIAGAITLIAGMNLAIRKQ